MRATSSVAGSALGTGGRGLGIGPPRSQCLEPANQLAETARAAAFTIDETDAGLIVTGMVDDPAGKVERRLTAGGRDLQHHIGADGRLDGAHQQAAAHADLTELRVHEVEPRRDADLAGDADRDAGVLAATGEGGRPLAPQIGRATSEL